MMKQKKPCRSQSSFAGFNGQKFDFNRINNIVAHTSQK